MNARLHPKEQEMTKHAMMPEQDFELQWKYIHEQDEAIEEGRKGQKDQAIAQLFYACEWTQEKIADKVGKSQQWVCCRLRLGRFLNFTTRCSKNANVPKNLTEGRFRKYWATTSGTEEERFCQVAELMNTELALVKPPQNVGERIVKAFAEAGWVTEEAIFAELEDVDQQSIRTALSRIKNNNTHGCMLEEKKDRGRRHVRITRLPKKEKIALGEVLKLRKELEPLLDEGESLTKVHRAELSPQSILFVFVRIKRILAKLDELMSD